MEYVVKNNWNALPEYPNKQINIGPTKLGTIEGFIISKVKIGTRWAKIRASASMSHTYIGDEDKYNTIFKNLNTEVKNMYNIYTKNGKDNKEDLYDDEGWIINPKIDGSSKYYDINHDKTVR